MGRRIRHRASEWLIGSCGVWMIGLGLYFILVRPPLLPEDPRYIGTDLTIIQAALPGLARWLRLVFTVMGGFMGAVGIFTTYLAGTLMPSRPRGLLPVLVGMGVFSVVLMSAVNFVLHSDFRWLLSMPALAWAVGVLCFHLDSRRLSVRSA